MTVVDASAIVAILTGAAEADALTDALEAARSPITSPVAVFEAVRGLCRQYHVSVAEAHQDVLEFLGAAGVRTVSITAKEAEAVFDAFSRYGEGRSHPAQLSLGDCFSYALAQSYHATLLFEGGGFGKTDIRVTPPRPR